MVCCADSEGECIPYDDPPLELGDGKPCVQGYCEAVSFSFNVDNG